MATQRLAGARLRRLAAWLVGLAIVAVIAMRLPFSELHSAMAQGRHLRLAAANVLIILLILITDVFSTQVGLDVLDLRWRFVRVLAVRGATYVLAILNYAVGQAGLGYYLHLAGARPARAVGTTLFLTGTTFATLLLVTTAAWTVDGGGGPLWWILLSGCLALTVYLGVIAHGPFSILCRPVFDVLFEAGVSGHLLAILGRVPHVVLLVLGYWFAMRAWGLEVPFAVAATVMPGVVLAAVLPISPAGLGTTQAAMVYLFGSYAPGGTAEERAAHVLAFGVVYFVYGVIGQLVVGLACRELLKWQDRRLAASNAIEVQALGTEGG
jgi:hypothetical protein